MQPPDERQQHLEQLLAAIQQRWGVHALRRLEQAASADKGISTGYSVLDALLGHGGVPRGMFTCLSGHPTSGVTTVALDIIAQAQASGEVTIYIDANRMLDPEYAVRRGIDPARLLIVWPQPSEVGFEMARDIILSGGAGVVVFALNSETSVSGQSLRRLKAALSRTLYAFICLSPTSDSLIGAQSDVHLCVERLHWLRDTGRVTGYEVRATALKNKAAVSGRTATFTVVLDKLRRSP